MRCATGRLEEKDEARRGGGESGLEVSDASIGSKGR